MHAKYMIKVETTLIIANSSHIYVTYYNKEKNTSVPYMSEATVFNSTEDANRSIEKFKKSLGKMKIKFKFEIVEI